MPATPEPSPGLAGFAGLARVPGAPAFSAVGLVARLPLSMVGLGIVLLWTSRDPSYALAGALAATFALAAALIAPFGSRFSDRFGQRRVLPVLAALQSAGLVGLVAGIDAGWPLPALFVLAAFAGGAAPNIGALVRSRWTNVLRGDRRLRTAFAWESILDEVVFIVGPPLATALALQVRPDAPLLVSALVVLGGATALAALRRTDPGPSAAPRAHRGGHALLLPGMARITAIMVLLGGIFGSFEVTTVAFAQEAGRAGATGVLLALYAVGSLVGGVLIGAFHPPMSLTRQLVAAAGLLAAVSAPIWLAPGVEVLAVLAFAAGLAVAPVLIITTALTEQLVPGARLTEALTVTVSGIAIGLSASAPLAGVVIDTASPNAAYAIMSGCALAAWVLAWAWRDRLAGLEEAPGRQAAAARP
jgi:MFS family permease